jgi:hypothetical protein
MSKRWITRSRRISSRAVTTCARSSHCYVQRTVDVPRCARDRAKRVHIRTARARSSASAIDERANLRDATAGAGSARASDFGASAIEHEAARGGRDHDHRGIRSNTTFRGGATAAIASTIEHHDGRAREHRRERDRAHELRARATSTPTDRAQTPRSFSLSSSQPASVVRPSPRPKPPHGFARVGATARHRGAGSTGRPSLDVQRHTAEILGPQLSSLGTPWSQSAWQRPPMT